MGKIVLSKDDLKLLLDCIELTLDYYQYNAFVKRFKTSGLIEFENHIRAMRDFSIVLRRYDLKLLIDCLELTLDYFNYNPLVRRFKTAGLIEYNERIKVIRDYINDLFSNCKRNNYTFRIEIEK